MNILSVGKAFPSHYYDQSQLTDALRSFWGERLHNPRRLEQVQRNVLVGGRHLALSIEQYRALRDFGDANDAFIRTAVDLGEEAIRDALDQARLPASAVQNIFFTTVTGIAAPSIDARLVNRLGLPTDIKRTPMFGLGCVAGAAGIARAADVLRGSPNEVAVLLSVELCSLTLQREDLSIPNLIASGLFGDGAAAVVMAGRELRRPGPEVLATRSVFFPDTEDVMGWEIGPSGFRIVLSSDVPRIAHGLRKHVDEFLAAHGLTLPDVEHFVCHPGGPKVLEALEEALKLPADALALSWRSLREIGNLSSASVLLVLADTLAARPSPESLGLLIAMGPGFCAEMVLLRW